MGWIIRLVLNICFAGLVLSRASSLLAYPTPVDFDGKLSRWNISIGADPITFEVVGDDENDVITFNTAADDAAAMWGNVPTSYFSYSRVLDDQKAQVTINLQHSIEGGDYSAGYALYDETDASGPTHCSIFVSVGAGESYGSVAKTLLHELGHCVGLGHSVIPQAIMSYELTKNSFALDVDDEAGVSRLYPADGSKPKLPPGCAVGSYAQNSFSRLEVLLLLALPFLLAARRKRRQV